MSEPNHQNLQQLSLNQILLWTRTYNSNIRTKSYREPELATAKSEPNHTVNQNLQQQNLNQII